TYRLYAHDYFGHRASNFSEQSGKGSPEIGLSPVLDQSEQLKDNSVHLKWSIMPEFENLVESWKIYVGTGWDGPYVPDTMGLTPKTRELRRRIPFDAAYFRVVAVDKSGKEHSSFPKLVMSY